MGAVLVFAAVVPGAATHVLAGHDHGDHTIVRAGSLFEIDCGHDAEAQSMTILYQQPDEGGVGNGQGRALRQALVEAVESFTGRPNPGLVRAAVVSEVSGPLERAGVRRGAALPERASGSRGVPGEFNVLTDVGEFGIVAVDGDGGWEIHEIASCQSSIDRARALGGGGS